MIGAGQRLVDCLTDVHIAAGRFTPFRRVDLEVHCGAGEEPVTDDPLFAGSAADASAHARMSEASFTAHGHAALVALLATVIEAGADAWSDVGAVLSVSPLGSPELRLSLTPHRCVSSIRWHIRHPGRPANGDRLALAGEIAASAVPRGDHPVLHTDLLSLPADHRYRPAGFAPALYGSNGTMGIAAPTPAAAARRAILLACATLLGMELDPEPAIIPGAVVGSPATRGDGYHVITRKDAEAAFAPIGPAEALLRRQIANPRRHGSLGRRVLCTADLPDGHGAY